MFPTAGLREQLLVRESGAVQYVRFSVSSDKINVKTSFGRQPCSMCVSQPWVRCAHHGRFTKIFGSAWIALNWVRCAHRGRFTLTALLWRRRFARAGGPHALLVLFHTVGLRRLLFRGGDGSPAQVDHMRCLFCFTRSVYADCSFVAETVCPRRWTTCAACFVSHGRLTQVATGAGGTGGWGESFVVALAVGAQDRSYLLAGERVE
jgi:hypothetical protein